MRRAWFHSPAVTVLALLLVCLAGRARADDRALDTAGFQRLLQTAPQSVFLLDVRTPREFSSGRIPGSVLIPMQEVPDRLAEIPRDKQVVVVCASGARSGAVTRYLHDNGYLSALNYTGGIFDWSRRGLQLER